MTHHHPMTTRARLAAAVAVAALLASPTAAQASSPALGAPRAAVAAEPSGPCTDPSGITVVVDSTDLGGGVEVGCAAAAATGTEAIEAAGFTDTRDASGLICAIGSLPDPCPTEFTGSYWSYWFAEPGGAWQTYMEGPDAAVPVAGNVEGWRYSDGSAGPTLAAPAATVAPSPTPTPSASETAAADDTAAGPTAEATVAATDTDPAQPGPSPVLIVGIGLLVVLALGTIVLARRRNSMHGPAGQD